MGTSPRSRRPERRRSQRHCNDSSEHPDDDELASCDDVNIGDVATKSGVILQASSSRHRKTKHAQSQRHTNSRNDLNDVLVHTDNDGLSSEVSSPDHASVQNSMALQVEFNKPPCDDKCSNTAKEKIVTQSETDPMVKHPPTKEPSFFDTPYFPSFQAMFFTSTNQDTGEDEQVPHPSYTEKQVPQPSPPEQQDEDETYQQLAETTLAPVAAWLQSVFFDTYSPSAGCFVDDISEVTFASTESSSKPRAKIVEDSNPMTGIPFVIAYPSKFKPKALTSEATFLGISFGPLWSTRISTEAEKGSNDRSAADILLDLGRALIRPAVKQISDILNIKIGSSDPSARLQANATGAKCTDFNTQDLRRQTSKNSSPSQDNDTNRRRKTSSESNGSKEALFERQGSRLSMASKRDDQNVAFKSAQDGLERSRRSGYRRQSSRQSIASKRTSCTDTRQTSRRDDFQRQRSHQSMASVRPHRSELGSSRDLASPGGQRLPLQRQCSSQSIITRRSSLPHRLSLAKTPSRRRFANQRRQSYLNRRSSGVSTNSSRRFTRSSSTRSVMSGCTDLDYLTTAAYKQWSGDEGGTDFGGPNRNGRSRLARSGSRVGMGHRRSAVRREQSVQSCLM